MPMPCFPVLYIHTPSKNNDPIHAENLLPSSHSFSAGTNSDFAPLKGEAKYIWKSVKERESVHCGSIGQDGLKR